MRRTYSSSLNFARSAIVLLSTPEVSLPVFFFIVLYASLIFSSLDDFHQMVEGFIFLTFCIQPVKSTFHVVILWVADFSLFTFPFLLPRSQHRHPLLRFGFSLSYSKLCLLCFHFHCWIRLVAIPPPLTYSRLHRYCATTLTGIKNGYCPLAKVFPSTTSLACNRLRVPSFPRSDIPIIGYL